MCGVDHPAADERAAAERPVGMTGRCLQLPASLGTQLQLRAGSPFRPAGLAGQVAAGLRSAWAAMPLQLVPGAVAVAVAAALLWAAAAAAAGAPSTASRNGDFA